MIVKKPKKANTCASALFGTTNVGVREGYSYKNMPPNEKDKPKTKRYHFFIYGWNG